MLDLLAAVPQPPCILDVGCDARCMMSGVRTTINIDDDVLLAAKQRAALEGTSVGHALSAMAREGMRTARSRRSRNGVPLIPNATKTVSAECVQELLDESP